MFKSYYYLNRLVLELQSILINKKILGCFSQDKDKLMIQTDSDSIWIEISVNNSEPYFTLKNRFARAKKNTLDFFDSINNSVITDVKIANDDRVIKILTSKGFVYFAIRGKFTNVFFDDHNSLKSFKQEEPEVLLEIHKELNTKLFINNFNLFDPKNIYNKDISTLRSEHKFIGKEIENEVKLRKTINQTTSNDWEILLNILNDIQFNKAVLCIDETNSDIKIAFTSLKLFNDYHKLEFDTVVSAFNQFLIKKYQIVNEHSKLKLINLFLDKELKRLSNKLNDLLTVINEGPKEKLYINYANLILININTDQHNLKEIEVDDIYDLENPQNRIKIKLDKKLSLQKNANAYFEKAKDSKLTFEKSKDLYQQSKIRFEMLTKIKNEITNPMSDERITSIMKELKIKESNKTASETESSIKFKHYLLENKYHVYVGKDSANNDLLTTKFAKQNDFWFHARSVSGSHVVLRVENTKEIIPKNILKKTASLAAYHSKAKTAGIVPVAYTLKKYVIKKKGMPAGQVALLREEVLLVKPEIPVDAEYLTE